MLAVLPPPPSGQISEGAHSTGQKGVCQNIVSFQAEVAAQGHYFMVCNLLHFLASKSVQEHPFPLKCGEGQRPPAPFPVCYAYGILSTLASIYEYMWQSAIDSHGAEQKIPLTFAIFGFVCLFVCLF